MTKPRKEIREWYVRRALDSITGLAVVWMDLTHDEVIYCLDLESKTRRRKSTITSLIRRAVKHKKLEYLNHLKELYDGKEDSVRP